MVREFIFNSLAEYKPRDTKHKEAYELYIRGDYQGVKLISACYPESPYIRCLAYWSETFEPSSSVCLVIAEAMRVAAEFAHDTIYENQMRYLDETDDKHDIASKAVMKEREYNLLCYGVMLRRVIRDV